MDSCPFSSSVCKKTSLSTLLEQFLTSLNHRDLRRILLRQNVHITPTHQSPYPVLPSFPFRCYSQAQYEPAIPVGPPRRRLHNRHACEQVHPVSAMRCAIAPAGLEPVDPRG